MIRKAVINLRTFEEIEDFVKVESIKRGWSKSQYVEWCVTEQIKGGK